MNKKITFIFLTLFLFGNIESLYSDFIWPIDRPKRVTGTFAEYRGARFHHGLDISCAGKKGFKVYSSDAGYIKTVMYQKYGIGYAIFVQHKNGFSTLYGHMNSFSRLILKNKTINQFFNHIRNRWDFRYDFTRPEIFVRKGSVIGYSGDSGIGIEHFHFEIRNKNNDPINPLRYGFTVPDKSSPLIKEVYLVPLDAYSHVDGFSQESVLNTSLSNKKKKIYSISSNYLPTVAGKIGIKVKTYDRAGYINKVAPYKIELRVNNKSIYKIVFDRIRKDFSHRMGLYYDYDNSSFSSFTFFLYSKNSKKGTITTTSSDKIINITIICTDANNNTSKLILPIKTGKLLKKPDYYYKSNFHPNQSLEMESSNNQFQIFFQKDSAIYDEMIFLNTDKPFQIYHKGLSSKSMIYDLMPTDLCIDKPAKIRILYSGKDYKKIGIYRISPYRNNFFFIGNSYDKSKNQFTSSIKKLGRFFLVRDDTPPRIYFSSKRRRRRRRQNKKLYLKKQHSIKFYLTDIGSGIDLSKVYLRVDTKKVFWYYDPDKRYLEILPHNKIWEKGKHAISLQISDRAGNNSKKKYVTYYIK